MHLIKLVERPITMVRKFHESFMKYFIFVKNLNIFFFVLLKCLYFVVK